MNRRGLSAVEKSMRLRAFLAAAPSILLGCPHSAPSDPRGPDGAIAAAQRIDTRQPSSLPPPVGDSVTLHRTSCHGSCAAYDVTIYASGFVAWHGEAYVSRIGGATREIAPEVAGRLVHAAVELARSGFETAACGGDAGAVGLTVRTGDDERSLWVGGMLLLETCDDDGRCAPQPLPPKFAAWADAIRGVDALAQEIDRVVPTHDWVDDPDCRDLPVERLDARTSSGNAEVEADHAAVAQRLRRDPDAFVRIAGVWGEDTRARLDSHRRALIEHGVAPERILLEGLHRPEPGDQGAGLTLAVGPRKCFAAAH
jgi:hypothetical protein